MTSMFPTLLCVPNAFGGCDWTSGGWVPLLRLTVDDGDRVLVAFTASGLLRWTARFGPSAPDDVFNAALSAARADARNWLDAHP